MPVIKNEIVKMNGSEHYIGIVNLTETTSTINVSSTPQQAMFNIGDEKMFDLDDNDFYDMSIKLNSILDDEASITLKLINEEIPVLIEEVQDGEEEIWKSRFLLSQQQKSL